MIPFHGGIWLPWGREASSLPLDFSVNLNPWGPPPELRENWDRLFSYLTFYPPLELEFYQQLLARLYPFFPPSAILPGNGATQIIYLLGRELEGETVGIVEPSFSEYRRAFSQAGWTVLPILAPPLVEEKDVWQAIRDQRPDCLIVGNPPSPSGFPFSAYFWQEVLSFCRYQKINLVVDEVFQEFMGEESSLASQIEESRNLYLVRSLTKYWSLPGLRGGFLASHPQNITALAPRIEPWSINSLLTAVLELLAASDLAAFQQITRVNLRTEKQFLEENLPSELQLFPSRVNFYLARVETGDLASFLEEQGIKVRRAQNFWGLDQRFVRLAVRNHSDNEQLVKAVKEFVRSQR